MKKYAALLAVLTSTVTLAADQSFVDFAVKQAHSQGFTGCDAAIKLQHRNAGGSDIRTNVTTYKDNPNLLTMLSTWGSKDDSVFSKATYLKQGQECFYDVTTIITTSKSCLAYAQSVPAFKYIAEAGDYIWMKNEGGANLLLTPAGNGCVATFSVDQKA
ncbi:hypothetical protein ACYCFC_15770 [Stutzerimonas sp. NM35]